MATASDHASNQQDWLKPHEVYWEEAIRKIEGIACPAAPKRKFMQIFPGPLKRH